MNTKPPTGTVLTFKFFRKPNGRLQATCQELGITKPVESQDGRRYKFLKVFQMYYWFSEEDVWRLQLAEEGDVIKVKVV